MSKLFIMCFGCLLVTAVNASGVRELRLDECLNKETVCVEIASESLQLSYRYLGSTEQWHFWGETLTATDGDMPFSSTYGYKIPRDSLEVSPVNTIAENQLNHWVSPNSCPKIIKLELAENRVFVEESKCYGFE